MFRRFRPFRLFKLIIFAIVFILFTASILHVILINEIKYKQNKQKDTETTQIQSDSTRVIFRNDFQHFQTENQAKNVVTVSDAIDQANHLIKTTLTPSNLVKTTLTPSNLISHLSIENIYQENPFNNPDGGVWKQGWDIQYNIDEFQNSKLKVFVVPHSHNDPGWIKTFDRYFTERTKKILDNAANKLSQNNDMKFIWSEISYLSKWWSATDDNDLKDKMKRVIQNGQLEITTGGWVMNDEANTHYFAMISQMIEGHEWLLDNLNYRPKYGWAIDPFGLSPTMAFILKQMGFKAMVIQRVHYSIKKYLAQRQALEFNWKQFWEGNINEQKQNDILCHVEPFFSYDVPHTCGPDPKICCQFDFKRLPPTRIKCPWKISPQVIKDSNVEERAQLLLDQYRKKSMLYRTKSLLVPLGDDFRYDEVKEWDNQYNNYIKIFEHLNSDPRYNVEISFGTLSDYFESLQKDTEFPSLVGDFFTYCDRDDNYWSGFYTSKPFYKRFDRVLEAHLRSGEIIFSLAQLINPNSTLHSLKPQLTYARQNLGLFQHHDGITGTAKADVVIDYAKRMLNSIDNLEKVTAHSLMKILNYTNIQNVNFQLTEKFTQIDSPPSKIVLNFENNQQIYYIVAFNSLGHSREEVICVDVNAIDTNFCVEDSNGKKLEIQLNYVWIKEELQKNKYEVCFLGSFKALSLNRFKIFKCDNNNGDDVPNLSQVSLYRYSHFDMKHITNQDEIPNQLAIENDLVQLEFSGNDGMIRRVIFKDSKEGIGEHNFRMSLMSYGTKTEKKVQKSGAYIFLPDHEQAQDIVYSKPKIRLTKGIIFDRLEVILDKPFYFKNQITLIKGRRFFQLENEFDLASGPFNNKELFIRFYTDIQNNDIFYTDLNGFQMVKRKRYSKIPLQGNVYPMPTMAYIQDETTRLNILSGQPLGVTSLQNSWLDIFLDRRLMQDDARGLNQGVTDNKLTRETFEMIFESTPTDEIKPSVKVQTEMIGLLYPLVNMFSTETSAVSQVNLMENSLPSNIHLMNIRQSNKEKFSFFFHRFGVNCQNANCSDTFTLSNTFTQSLIKQVNFNIKKISLSLINVENDKLNLNDNITIDEMNINVFMVNSK